MTTGWYNSLMIKLRAFWESFIVLILISILHFAGSNLNWYWTYKWFDIPMHFLGGLWVALTALWIFCYFGYTNSITNYKFRTFFVVLFTVLIVGVSWEIFEVFGKMTFINDVGYWFDTTKDLTNDFIGGIVAYLYFIKGKKSQNDLVVCDTKKGMICN